MLELTDDLQLPVVGDKRQFMLQLLGGKDYDMFIECFGGSKLRLLHFLAERSTVHKFKYTLDGKQYHLKLWAYNQKQRHVQVMLHVMGLSQNSKKSYYDAKVKLIEANLLYALNKPQKFLLVNPYCLFNSSFKSLTPAQEAWDLVVHGVLPKSAEKKATKQSAQRKFAQENHSGPSFYDIGEDALTQ